MKGRSRFPRLPSAAQRVPGDQMSLGQDTGTIWTSIRQPCEAADVRQRKTPGDFGIRHWEYGGFTYDSTSATSLGDGEAGMLQLASNQADAMSKTTRFRASVDAAVGVQRNSVRLIHNSLCGGDRRRVSHTEVRVLFLSEPAKPSVVVPASVPGRWCISPILHLLIAAYREVFSNCTQVRLTQNSTSSGQSLRM